MVVSATWRDDPACPTPGRRGGRTFREAWSRARAVGPKFSMVVSWNEWIRAEQPSAEISKDLEPSRGHGRLYLDLLGEQIRLIKAGT